MKIGDQDLSDLVRVARANGQTPHHVIAEYNLKRVQDYLSVNPFATRQEVMNALNLSRMQVLLCFSKLNYTPGGPSFKQRMIPEIKRFMTSHLGCTPKEIAFHFDLSGDQARRYIRSIRREWKEN